MNYQEAAIIRKKSFAEIMTQKLIEGQGLISSVGSARRDIKQAKKLARKEKFDILNVAKFLTGGSTLAPAILGRMLGRKSSDISYFAGRKMLGDTTESNKVLIQILDFMKTSRQQKEKDFQTHMMYQEMNELMRNDRHQEVLNVFLDAIKKNSTPKRRRVRAITSPMSGGFATTALLVTGAAGLLMMSKESVAAIRKRSDDDLKILETETDKQVKSLQSPYDEIYFIAEEDKISSEYKKELQEISDTDEKWKEIENISEEEKEEAAPRGGGLTLMKEAIPDVGPEPTATEVEPSLPKNLMPKARGLEKVEPETAKMVSPAQISIAGETGAKTITQAKQKSSQIVKNDPKKGHKSYGIFGMNTLSKTIDQFVSQNPQFGFENKPGTDAFDDEWKEISKTRSDEIYAAQVRWYENNVLEPLKKEMKSLLPTNLASDERILALLADRRVQYGRVMENDALQYALMSETPEEFINRVTEFDKENIGTAFKTYLSNNPGNEKGLLSRLDMRRRMALQFSYNTIGDRVQTSSVENQDMKKELKDVLSQTTIIFDNQNIVNQKTTQIAFNAQEQSLNPILSR